MSYRFGGKEKGHMNTCNSNNPGTAGKMLVISNCSCEMADGYLRVGFLGIIYKAIYTAEGMMR